MSRATSDSQSKTMTDWMAIDSIWKLYLVNGMQVLIILTSSVRPDPRDGENLLPFQQAF